MSRMVNCRKYSESLEGLSRPPYPGPRGQDIFENVSQKAWNEWLTHQTRLINEQRLQLFDVKTQTYLQEQLEKFLNNEDFAQAEGFVPK